MTTPRTERSLATVRHYCPGGREDGGGIGRLVGYIVDAAERRGATHMVCDTRGPAWTVPGSPLRLARAIGNLMWDRITAPGRIHHIHVAGRGSTSRKLILTRVARLIGARHLLHLHDYDYGTDLDLRGAAKQAAVARMFRGAERVVVLGQRDRATVIDRLGVGFDRTIVMHNAVPDPGPVPARTAEVPTILFLGRLSARKGVPELLEALARPKMASVPWRAVLAGDGLVESYRAKAAGLGLSDRVSMPGWVSEDQVRALCRQADVLVLPSHAEGLAMAVIEGLASSLAVVTTRVGAHDEALTDTETCRFVPVGDPAALAATLAELCRDAKQRQRLGDRGRALFLARYSIDAYIRQLDSVYGEHHSSITTFVGAE
jgi:glycosyltransferase involved in cell wall biosynthesis